MDSGFGGFLLTSRLQLGFQEDEPIRAVHRTDISNVSGASKLEKYMADRAPYFYKQPSDIGSEFEEGYFLSAIKAVLLRLPSAPSFRESHFGEILAAIYAEEVLGLRCLYSKLALLSAENTNAHKMDVVLYRPGCDPAEFVFAEVKSSMKHESDGLPANHDRSCFASLFTSYNQYSASDRDFDLAVVKERLATVNEPDAECIRKSLLPHRLHSIEFAGFCVIDISTYSASETRVLATRKNDHSFNVDLLCVTELSNVVDGTFGLLDSITRAVE